MQAAQYFSSAWNVDLLAKILADFEFLAKMLD